MQNRILTQHPAGKQGVKIARAKYDAVRAAILAAIQAGGGQIPFVDLAEAVGQRLPADFEGSVGWYTTTVKLDLEARAAIVRVDGRGLQALKLA